MQTKGKGLSKLAREATKTAQVRRGRDLLDEIRQKSQNVERDLFDIGEALVEIQKKELFLPLGYTTFDEMLATEDVMGRSQAYKMMAVVRAFPRRVRSSLGMEKSYALVRYAHATAPEESPMSLLTTGVHIDGKKMSVDGLSVRDLNREVRRTRLSRDNARRDNPRKSARLLTERGAKALSALLSERVTAKPVKVPEGWAVQVTMSVGALDTLAKLTSSKQTG